MKFFILQIFYYLRRILKISVAKLLILSEKPIQRTMFEDLSNDAELHITFNSQNLLTAINAVKSFYLKSEIYIPLYIHMDGKFDELTKYIIMKHLPFSNLITSSDEKKLHTELYPQIHNLRRKWQGKKLFDVFLFSQEKKKLIIDDDVMFFSKPLAIIEWIKTGSNPIFIQDSGKYCIISDIEMESLFHVRRISHNLNTGILGITNIKINFKEINDFILKITDIYNNRELGYEPKDWIFRNHHLIEQTIFYYLLSKHKKYSTLPVDKYLLWGHVDKGLLPAPKIKHPPIAIHFPGDLYRERVYGWYLRKRFNDYISH